MEENIQKVHEGYGYNRDIIFAMLPLLLMSFFNYGPRSLLLALVAVVTARIADRAAAMLRSRPYDRTETSSVSFALILVLMMPANLPFRVIVAAVLMAVLVAKEAFGGFESYPFHPAAVGFCMAAVSWPDYVLRYTPPKVWFVNLPGGLSQLLELWTFKGVDPLEGPSYILKTGGMPNISLWDLFLGNYAGPLGASSTLVILACAVYLLVRRRINFTVPLCFLSSAALVAFFFPRYNEISFASYFGDPEEIAMAFSYLGTELFSGALMFVAVFLACEPGTQPKNTAGRALYGVLLGVATMLFRYFGTFELGACFALLLVDALSGFIDRIAGGGKARAKEVAGP